jgi:hypothetical protein
MLPGIHALKLAMALNPLDLDFVMSDETGDLEILYDNTSIQPWMIDLMKSSLLVEIHPEEPQWRLTTMGRNLLTMLRSGPLHGMLAMGEMQRLQEVQKSRQETLYHG